MTLPTARVTATAELLLLDGVPCRVWQGVLADGTAVALFVHRLTVPSGTRSPLLDGLVRTRRPDAVTPDPEAR